MGDYGVSPKQAPFLVHARLIEHYMHGGYYPRGGSSEFAFHIIPVIEKAGGKVMVRAHVSDILLDSKKQKVLGVRVKSNFKILF